MQAAGARRCLMAEAAKYVAEKTAAEGRATPLIAGKGTRAGPRAKTRERQRVANEAPVALKAVAQLETQNHLRAQQANGSC